MSSVLLCSFIYVHSFAQRLFVQQRRRNLSPSARAREHECRARPQLQRHRTHTISANLQRHSLPQPPGNTSNLLDMHLKLKVIACALAVPRPPSARRPPPRATHCSAQHRRALLPPAPAPSPPPPAYHPLSPHHPPAELSRRAPAIRPGLL